MRNGAIMHPGATTSQGATRIHGMNNYGGAVSNSIPVIAEGGYTIILVTTYARYDELNLALLRRNKLRQYTDNYVRPGSDLNRLFGALFYHSEARHHSHKQASSTPSPVNSEKRTADVRSQSEEIRR